VGKQTEYETAFTGYRQKIIEQLHEVGVQENSSRCCCCCSCRLLSNFCCGPSKDEKSVIKIVEIMSTLQALWELDTRYQESNKQVIEIKKKIEKI
jgi:hypothetical protein